MLADQSAGIIAHTIQLAIAPVFLLTGLAGLLGIMGTRLARVIDRARSLEERWLSMDEAARRGRVASSANSSTGATYAAGPSTAARPRRSWSAW